MDRWWPIKWKTNTEYIVKNAAKQLHFSKILKGYNVPCEDLKTFYISAIRSILEYWTKIWHGSLTEEQFKGIERIQKRGWDLRTGIDWMWYGNFGKSKWKDVYKIDKRMKGLIHKLNKLLPPTVGHVRERDTRLNTNKFYHFKCRTDRFSNSP